MGASRARTASFCLHYIAVCGDLTVMVDDIEDLSSLACLEYVIGSMSIEGAALIDASLPALVRIDGTLELTELPAVETVSMPALTELGDSLYVMFGEELTSIALPSLPEVEGDVVVSYAPGLGELDLSSLEIVGGDLEIRDNAALLSLAGMPMLYGVDGDLALTGNDVLEDITQLHGLQWIGDDLVITDNPALSTSQTEALLDAIGEGSVGGQIVVGNNGD